MRRSILGLFVLLTALAGCAALFHKPSELTAYHNTRLARAIQQLDRELPEATIASVDAARLVDQILEGRSPDGSGERFD